MRWGENAEFLTLQLIRFNCRLGFPAAAFSDLNFRASLTALQSEVLDLA